eukprot:SAG31_NODE_2313_length_5956_cov_3.390302_1_plen_21_part_10
MYGQDWWIEDVSWRWMRHPGS